MDSLTLGAIALVLLVVIGSAIVLLRRRQDSSLGRMPLSLDEPAISTPAPRTSAALSSADRAALSAMVAGDRKLEAIKRVRELTGMGLKEAKDYVEALPRTALTDLPDPAQAPAVSVNPATLDLAEVSALLAGGNKIAAIKRVRELTGMGLKEAKDYVEAMPRSGAPPAPPSVPATPSAAADLTEVHLLAQQGNKIQAIKRYRELTGVGLKEAKDYVDRL